MKEGDVSKLTDLFRKYMDTSLPDNDYRKKVFKIIDKIKTMDQIAAIVLHGNDQPLAYLGFALAAILNSSENDLEIMQKIHDKKCLNCPQRQKRKKVIH